MTTRDQGGPPGASRGGSPVTARERLGPPIVPGTWVESGDDDAHRVRARVTSVKVVLVVDNHGYEQEWDAADVIPVEGGCTLDHPCTASLCERSLR